MRTDELIEALALDLSPARPGQVPRRLALAAGAGGAVALLATAFWLGLRPDLPDAARGSMFWMKEAYALALGLAGFLALERLARPAASGRAGLALAAVLVLTLLGLGAGELMAATPESRMAMWLGHSWRRCPVNILALSLPMLAVVLLVVRRFAPTRLALAGAAAGLFCGGVAAAAYGLHCTEATRAFLATWYSLGVALPAALGALIGPLALRWR